MKITGHRSYFFDKSTKAVKTIKTVLIKIRVRIKNAAQKSIASWEKN